MKMKYNLVLKRTTGKVATPADGRDLLVYVIFFTPSPTFPALPPTQHMSSSARFPPFRSMFPIHV